MTATWKCLALAAALAAAFVINTASADDYPSHPIKLIVPFAPGGAADAVARIIGKRVSETIGQPMVIENRGGAGAIIGTEDVHKADPDGYTLLLGQSGPISINPGVYKSLPYDPEKDFAPITMTSDYPYVLVVNARLPVEAVPGLRRPGAEPSPATSTTAPPASAPPNQPGHRTALQPAPA